MGISTGSEGYTEFFIPQEAKNTMKILNTFLLGGCLAILLVDISANGEQKYAQRRPLGPHCDSPQKVCGFQIADEFDHDNSCFSPILLEYMLRHKESPTERKNFKDNFKAVFEAMKAVKKTLPTKDYGGQKMIELDRAAPKLPKLKGSCLHKQKLKSTTKAQCSKYFGRKRMEDYWRRSKQAMIDSKFSALRTISYCPSMYSKKNSIQDRNMTEEDCGKWKFCDDILKEL